MNPLLEVERLSVRLPIDGRLQPVIHEVTLTLARGEVLAMVGESGSGKSMTARAVLGLLPPGAAAGGRVTFDGQDLLAARGGELRKIRLRRLGMIFQDPRAAINPVHRIGDFLTETLVRELGVSRPQALERAAAVLREVRISDPERCLRQYPHQLSGGMLQRVMIASVLLAEPDLILADEPTTALDVTTQAEVVALLDDLRRARGMAMIFITHDLELAAAISDRVAVMYAGRVVETLPSAAALSDPRHPYTEALLESRPDLRVRLAEIPQIPGRPLAAYEAGSGCPFHPRCRHAEDRCAEELPPMRVDGGGAVMCWLGDAPQESLLRAADPARASAPTADARAGDAASEFEASGR